ncbi:MAG: hypothetical protein LBJ00_16405 [Planctomycetaceae bacterium]|nr:hypothetical protein [Planctomycetaceae bacterium]
MRRITIITIPFKRGFFDITNNHKKPSSASCNVHLKSDADNADLGGYSQDQKKKSNPRPSLESAPPAY